MLGYSNTVCENKIRHTAVAGPSENEFTPIAESSKINLPGLVEMNCWIQ